MAPSESWKKLGRWHTNCCYQKDVCFTLFSTSVSLKNTLALMQFPQNIYLWLMTKATLKWHQSIFLKEGWFLETTNLSSNCSFNCQILLLLRQHGKMLISFGRFFHHSTLEDKDVKEGAIVRHMPWMHIQFHQSSTGLWHSEEVGTLHTPSSTLIMGLRSPSDGWSEPGTRHRRRETLSRVAVAVGRRHG